MHYFDFITVNVQWEISNYTVNVNVDNVEVCAEIFTLTQRTITLNVSYWDESACKFSIMYNYVTVLPTFLILISEQLLFNTQSLLHI